MTAEGALNWNTEPGRGVHVQQVVEAQFLALELAAGGEALLPGARAHVEAGGLVRVLAVAEGLLGFQADAQALGQGLGLGRSGGPAIQALMAAS